MHSKEFARNQGDNQIRMNLFIPSSKQACSPNPFKKKIYPILLYFLSENEVLIIKTFYKNKIQIKIPIKMGSNFVASALFRLQRY